MKKLTSSVLRALVLISLCTGFMACGNGSSASSSGSQSSSSAAIGTAGVALGTPVTTVDATDGLHFSPVTVTVKVGQIVQWVNTGTVTHNITFDNAPNLDNTTFTPGSKWEIKFTKAGTYPYHCSIHPGMDGKVVVQ